MSLDERIRQLSESVADELRGPIEASFRRVLGELLEAATAEREADTSSHQSALDDLGASLASEREAALAALRESLTAEHEAAMAALRDQAALQRETLVQSLTDELARNQQDEVVAMRQNLIAEHEAELARLREQSAQERDDAVVALHDQLTRDHVSDSVALRQHLAQEHEASLTELRATLVREHEEAVARLHAEHAVAKEEAVLRARLATDASSVASAAGLEQELDAVRAQARDVEEARAAAVARLESAREEIETLTRFKTSLESELTAAREELAHRTGGDVPASSEADLATAYTEERHAELACSERLLETLRRMDQAATLSEVLTVLADALAPEAGRAAVLVANGLRLRAWRMVGFADGNSDVEFAMTDDPLFASAMVKGIASSTSDPDVSPGRATANPAFALPADRVGLAVPVIVGTRPVAVVYVDDAGERATRVPSNWPEVAEVMARHAGRCLELLTVSGAAARIRAVAAGASDSRSRALKTTAADFDDRHVGSAGVEAVAVPPQPSPAEERAREEESAGRYARLLLSEVKLYNEEAVNEGRRAGDLLVRLHTEIERARRLYEEKIPLPVRERVNCFDDELVRTLAGGDRALLGQIT